MPFELPQLPYELNALEPHISEETLTFHHGKHHKTYVDKLNGLIPNTDFEGLTLEEIIQKSSGPVFNNAAQIWNHSFYWNCLSPNGGDEPTGALAAAIKESFGDFASFKEQFSAAAINTFGSGWAWLVKNSDNSLAIISSSNADTPIADGKQALMTCDVWEHAYYIDYRNARPKYLEAFWALINWDFAAENFER